MGNTPGQLEFLAIASGGQGCIDERVLFIYVSGLQPGLTGKIVDIYHSAPPVMGQRESSSQIHIVLHRNGNPKARLNLNAKSSWLLSYQD